MAKFLLFFLFLKPAGFKPFLAMPNRLVKRDFSEY